MRKPRNKRYLVAPVIIIGAVASLMLTGMKSNTLRAVPVDELRHADATNASFLKQRLRVVGRISEGQVLKTPIQTAGGTVEVAHFNIEERGQTLRVQYRDALPDTFRAGGPVQVDGVYVAPGLIEADHVLTKCPSKYEGARDAKNGAGNMSANGAAANGANNYQKSESALAKTASSETPVPAAGIAKISASELKTVRPNVS